MVYSQKGITFFKGLQGFKPSNLSSQTMQEMGRCSEESK